MTRIVKALPNRPWNEWVKRVVLHVPHYLSYTGDATSGGRQRNVRDIARIIRQRMQVDCVILQKGEHNWKAEDADGTPVHGLKSGLGVLGDPGFGRKTRAFLQPGDAIIYMGGEDAWPFFVKGAKGFHVGVWWDGPFSATAKRMTALRTEALFDACRSVLCVDTNVINWLRARPRNLLDTANRALYIPNCVDLSQLPLTRREMPNERLRILFARRFEFKRGPYLALDSARILNDRGVDFELVMSTAQGHEGSSEIIAAATERGIAHRVTTVVNDMDSIFELYLRSDISIVPTIWSEGTSYSAVESIAAGVPVVTTTVGGLPNVVIPGFNGYVCSPQASELADAIETYKQKAIWKNQHQNCLSMRDALSFDVWRDRVFKWLIS